jgi:hypothetical protein
MRSLLEVMKSAVYVHFVECRDKCLWYDLACADDVCVRPEWTLRFRIPLEDTLGGTFPSGDAGCGYYQRWIRQELELQKKEAAMVAQAREEWKP